MIVPGFAGSELRCCEQKLFAGSMWGSTLIEVGGHMLNMPSGVSQDRSFFRFLMSLSVCVFGGGPVGF